MKQDFDVYSRPFKNVYYTGCMFVWRYKLILFFLCIYILTNCSTNVSESFLISYLNCQVQQLWWIPLTWFDGIKNILPSTYRKIPNISPGLITVFGGLIFGGGEYIRKWVYVRIYLIKNHEDENDARKDDDCKNTDTILLNKIIDKRVFSLNVRLNSQNCCPMIPI